MLCCLVFAVNVIVVLLALLELWKTYSESGSPNATVSVEVDGETVDDVEHCNHKGVRKRGSMYVRFTQSSLKGTGLKRICTERFARFRLNADVVVDVLRFSSPDTIDACCLSSCQLNSVVTSCKPSLPLRSIDFVQIADRVTFRYRQVNMRCCAGDEKKGFKLSNVRSALSNCRVRRLEIDDAEGAYLAKIAGLTEVRTSVCH